MAADAAGVRRKGKGQRAGGRYRISEEGAPVECAMLFHAVKIQRGKEGSLQMEGKDNRFTNQAAFLR